MNGSKYAFGNIVVDLSAETLSRGGARVDIEPKAFQLLVLLIQSRGRLVQKQEALTAVWGESFVTENTLARAIAQLRKALGDEAKESNYIETVPTRGYRFVAEVRRERPTTKKRGRSTPVRLSFAALVAIVAIGLVLVLARIVGRPERDGDIRFLASVQVTSTPRFESFPSVSPDGKSVAFTSDRSGAFEIYVRQLASGGKEFQITSDGRQNLQPSWSPDGQYLAYHSMGRGGIWMIPALGGVAKQVCGFGSRPEWSPDGEAIALQSFPPGDVSVNAYAAMPPSTIWLCSVSGAEPTPFTRRAQPPGGHGSPSWSPDGERIAFVSSDSFLSGVWLQRVAGGEPERVPIGGTRVLDLRYSAVEERLYFTGVSGARDYALWTVPLSPETGGADGEPSLVSQAVHGVIRHPSFSADGKRVAYATLSITSNLASVRVSSPSFGPAGAPALLTDYTSDRATLPAFSPDGSSIAFTRSRFGSSTDIWLMDVDGGNARPLTMIQGVEEPQWLGEGDRIAFWDARGEAAAISTVSLDTRRVERLHEAGPDWGSFRVSRDGETIAFHARRASSVNLWTVPVGGRDERQLTFGAAVFPSWSPDGSLIAFQMNEGEDTQLAVIPAEGGTPVQLTRGHGQRWGAAWSPDGDKIAFAGSRDGVWNIWWVSRVDGTQKKLTNYTTVHHFVRYPNWSPRGDQIVYEYAETTGDIWLADLP